MRLQLPLRQDVLEMQTHVVRAHIKQLGHFTLGKPYRFGLGPQLNLALAVVGGVKDQVAHPCKGELLPPNSTSPSRKALALGHAGCAAARSSSYRSATPHIFFAKMILLLPGP